MKKLQQILIVLFLLGIVVSQIACEKDDVCLEEHLTPKLVLVLYDQTAPDDKLPAEHLTVVALPDNDTLLNYKNVTTDSLAIPLDVNHDTCSFLWIKDGNTDRLDFTYEREPVFISKSCGYKTIFHQLQVNLVADGDNWINNITVLQPEVTIDTLQHVKVFH